MTRPSVRREAKLLLRLVNLTQKSARLANLAKKYNHAFAEQVARYADTHPSVSR